MADTAIRYISMLQLIPRYPQSISTTALQITLAEQGFDINVRSIQRDLEKLSVYFPLISDETVKPFAWSFDAQAAAKVFPMLDMPAAVTLELARSYLKPILPPKILANLSPHFKEAQAVLKRNGSALAQWPEKIRVISRGLDSERPQLSADVLETITQALLDEHKCTIAYFGRRWDSVETIIVHPLGLVFRDPNTYLIATIDGREQVRQLALHRMQSAESIHEQITKPIDFDLDEFISRGEMHILHSTQPIKLKLRCDKPQLSHLMDSPIGNDQKIENENELNFELSVTIADSKDLRWWLLAQAAHIDILAPDTLLEEIKTELRNGLHRNCAR